MWNALSLSRLDPHTKQCEPKIQKITYLQSIAKQLPDALQSKESNQITNIKMHML